MNIEKLIALLILLSHTKVAKVSNTARYAILPCALYV